MAGAQLAAPPNFPVTIMGACLLIATGVVLQPKLDRKLPVEDSEEIVKR